MQITGAIIRKQYYTPLIVSMVFLWLALYLLFPHYQHYVDPDGTAYLTISDRYAMGDFMKAINGLWSPWSCWLTAALMHVGMDAIPASIIINTAGATGFLAISYSFFLLYGFGRQLLWWASGTLVVFLCYAVFAQTFDDLWQCVFTLTILRIILKDRFTEKPWLWIAIGAIGACAYFAKAYSLPFFVLNTTCCLLLITSGNLKRTAMIVSVSLAVLLLFAFPWLYALHSKYGMWTTSTAGALNMSWYLVGHPEWKEGINILLPPVYPDSPYFWEDPFYVNGHLSHFWDSAYLLGRQVLRVGYNFFSLAYCMTQLSVVFPLLGLLIVSTVIRWKKFRLLPIKEQVLYATILLLPAGYILVHIESRYLWYMLTPGIIIAVRQIQKYNFKKASPGTLGLVILFLSIWVYPLWQMAVMYHTGDKEYALAMKLKQAGIVGKDLVSDIHPRSLSKIAYFSGNQFYAVSKQSTEKNMQIGNEQKNENTRQLVKDINKYNIRYYLYASESSGELMNPGFFDLFFGNLKDSAGKINHPKIVTDESGQIVLYDLNELHQPGGRK